MALGWALPRQILAHGWWIWQGSKMSKSVGNVVRPEELVPEFGVDGLRFYLLREMTLGQDSSFSYESILRRLNAAFFTMNGVIAMVFLAFVATDVWLRR